MLYRGRVARAVANCPLTAQMQFDWAEFSVVKQRVFGRASTLPTWMICMCKHMWGDDRNKRVRGAVGN